MWCRTHYTSSSAHQISVRQRWRVGTTKARSSRLQPPTLARVTRFRSHHTSPGTAFSTAPSSKPCSVCQVSRSCCIAAKEGDGAGRWTCPAKLRLLQIAPSAPYRRVARHERFEKGVSHLPHGTATPLTQHVCSRVLCEPPSRCLGPTPCS